MRCELAGRVERGWRGLLSSRRLLLLIRLDVEPRRASGVFPDGLSRTFSFPFFLLASTLDFRARGGACPTSDSLCGIESLATSQTDDNGEPSGP